MIPTVLKPYSEFISSYRVLLTALIVQFLVIHLTNDVLVNLFGQFSPSLVQTVIWLKPKLFFLTLLILLPQLILALKNAYAFCNLRVLGYSAGLFFLLVFLFGPMGLGSMGIEYATMSQSPFSTEAGVFSKRILMPVIGYITKLRGNTYYLFGSLIYAFHLIVLVNAYLNAQKIKIGFILRSSLATTSFIAFQFFYPGYPDALLFNLICLLTCFEQPKRVQMVLFGLAVASHEGALFVLLPYLFFRTHPSVFRYCLGLTAIYVLVYGSCYRLNVTAVFSSHNSVQPAIQYILERPMLFVAGLFFAFKGLWAMIGLWMWQLCKQKHYSDIKVAAGMLLGAAIPIVLGIDTSRLLGFAFPVLLFAFKLFSEAQVGSYKRVLVFILIFNLMVPFMNITLNRTELSLNYKFIPVSFRTIKLNPHKKSDGNQKKGRLKNFPRAGGNIEAVE